jgi:RHS repeat-associated protein
LDGNLTQQVAFLHYNWNALGQLTSVSNIPSTASYGYDAWGRRVRITVGTSSTGFLYDGVQALVEVDTAGHTTAEYSFYPGRDHPHSVQLGGASGTNYAVATDGLGNVTGLISDADSVPNWYRYDPFGFVIDYQAPSGATTRLGFQSMPFDVTSGLSYARARYYDPVLGRFISEDSLGLAGGINPYVFAGNSPVSPHDPSGLVECFADGGYCLGTVTVSGTPGCDWLAATLCGAGGGLGTATMGGADDGQEQGQGGGGTQPGATPQTRTSGKKAQTSTPSRLDQHI